VVSCDSEPSVACLGLGLELAPELAEFKLPSRAPKNCGGCPLDLWLSAMDLVG